MNLPKLQDISVGGKRVILRADLDMDVTVPDQEFRLKALVPTLKYLTENKANIIIIGHKGRPNGVKVESLSLTGFAPVLGKLIGKEIVFEGPGEIVLKENLRFDPGEEKNDPEFTKKIASWGDIFVNEAFASSHRAHSSIVGLPKLLPHAPGLRFSEEIKILNGLLEKPLRPLIFVIGGAKKDKVEFIGPLGEIADKVLVGGRLPDYLGDESLVSVRVRGEEEKIIIGNLVMDKEDITIHSMERFEQEIAKAKTIVLAGPMGKFEEEGHRQGTKRVIEAIVKTPAYKVVGGGDTIAALSRLGFQNKFDGISVGGGAMLEFLAKKTLPGIEALSH